MPSTEYNLSTALADQANDLAETRARFDAEHTLPLDHFALWLEAAAVDPWGFPARCRFGVLQRAGYVIQRTDDAAPWKLLKDGELISQEFYPLAERAATATRVVPEPARVCPDGSLSGPLVFGERKAGAWRWYAMQERMRAVGEA